MEDKHIYSTKFCYLCHAIDESVDASVVCKAEHIYLCDSCGRRHQIQRATKSHVIIAIEKDILCEICLVENEKMPAYGYCETCDDSEYMCRSCSKRHTASNMFRSHSVNTDLKSKTNKSQPSGKVHIPF
jgi:hypothetical protein